jgi:hypothetical protein
MELLKITRADIVILESLHARMALQALFTDIT